MTENTLPAVQSSSAPKRSLLGYWVMLLTFLAMLAATGFAVRNMRHQLKNDILKLDVKVNQLSDGQDEQVDSLNEALSNTKLRIDNNLNDHQSRLSELEMRVLDHQNRLQSLTNRTLDDRLLAETLLLVKQANLRLQLEHDVGGAQLLLAEAEQLLNSTTAVDSDLLGVRQTLNRDLTTLKLITPLDKEGLYLRLNSLLELISKLPLQPNFESLPPSANATEDLALDEHSSWTDWLAHSINRLGASLKNYIRLEDRSDQVKPVLNQEAAKLVQLNLRLLLEQAQVALLQQRGSIYQQSLRNADQLLNDYFWESTALSEYHRNLQQLAEVDVAPTLPNLVDSLGQLQTYLQHKHDNASAGSLTP